MYKTRGCQKIKKKPKDGKRKRVRKSFEISPEGVTCPGEEGHTKSYLVILPESGKCDLGFCFEDEAAPDLGASLTRTARRGKASLDPNFLSPVMLGSTRRVIQGRCTADSYPSGGLGKGGMR